jgi:hypothetical protein
MNARAQHFEVETPQPPARRRVVTIDAAALLTAEFPPRLMLLSPWLMSQFLVMIHAWRGVGKTYVALWIAYALASAGKFLNWSVDKPVSVLYIDGEMPGAALAERVANIITASDREANPGMLRFITPDLQPNGVMPNLADAEGQKAIDDVIGDAKVIVVDNLSCLARGGKENEAESWHPIAEWALRQRTAGRSVIFIHHSGKGGAQRGTSKREDLLDVVISLRRPVDYTPDQGARFEVHFEKARSLCGEDVAAFEAMLTTDADNKQTWTMRTVEDASDGQTIELAKLGMNQADIAKELRVNRSTVMRRLKKAESEGRYKPPVQARKGGSNA